MAPRDLPPETSTHYKLPQSRGGLHNPDNLVQVNSEKLYAWRTLFKDYTPEQIAEIISRTWIPNSCQMVVRRTHGQAEQMPKPPLPEVH